MKIILNLLFAFALLISANAQKVKLQLNLIKGQTYNQTMSSVVSANQTINGKTMDMNMTISGRMSNKVIDIRKSIFDIEVKYESMTMTMNMQDSIREFSSEKANDTSVYSTLMHSIIGKSFFIRMTKTGEIKEIKNIDSIFTKMLDKMPHFSQAEKQHILAMIKQSFGEKSFKGSLEMGSHIFPGTKVSKGDTWIINTKMESGFIGRVETTYQLKEINDSFCTISGVSKITSSENDSMVMSGMTMKFNMTGTSTLNIKTYKKSGWIKEATINRNSSGDIRILGNPNIPGGMKMQMTSKNETRITDK